MPYFAASSSAFRMPSISGLRELLVRLLAPADEHLVGVVAVVMVVVMLVLVVLVVMMVAAAVRDRRIVVIIVTMAFMQSS